MTIKIRQARELISREQYDNATFIIVAFVVDKLLHKIPNAQHIEIAVSEWYDDEYDAGPPVDFESGPPMAEWLRDDEPREQYPELTGWNNR